MAKSPWEIHPDLTLPRLQLLEALLREVRHRALALHDPLEDDNNWSLGCRIYARSCGALLRASEQWDWLGIIDSGQEFVFTIGAVPVRFYHGDSECPETSRLEPAAAELVQLGMGYGDTAMDLLWRLAIETNTGGEVSRIVLIGAHTEGGIDIHFPIPRNEKLAVVTTLRAPVKRGVTLPPPRVTVLNPKRAGERRSDGDGEPQV